MSKPLASCVTMPEEISPNASHTEIKRNGNAYEQMCYNLQIFPSKIRIGSGKIQKDSHRRRHYDFTKAKVTVFLIFKSRTFVNKIPSIMLNIGTRLQSP